jgi:uncharacterized protein YbjQ (UPF0145 family)
MAGLSMMVGGEVKADAEMLGEARNESMRTWKPTRKICGGRSD